jgi:hypothetical protein
MTFIMSELGFVYFLGRTEARKAVAVYSVSLAQVKECSLTPRACASAGALPALMHPTALENSCRVCAYMRIRSLHSRIPLSASYLEVEKVVRAQFEDYLLQGGLVGFQEKEFPPVPFRFLVVLLILRYC